MSNLGSSGNQALVLASSLISPQTIHATHEDQRFSDTSTAKVSEPVENFTSSSCYETHINSFEKMTNTETSSAQVSSNRSRSHSNSTDNPVEVRVIIHPSSQQIDSLESNSEFLPFVSKHKINGHARNEEYTDQLDEPEFQASTAPTLCFPISVMSLEAPANGLSSPFMEKRQVVEQRSRSKAQDFTRTRLNSLETRITSTGDISRAKNLAGSRDVGRFSLTPPRSPITSMEAPGVEMRCLHNQEKSVPDQGTEHCRSDHINQTERTVSESGPAALHNDEKNRQQKREGPIKIIDSPLKGRRLTFFQETSEESFEESLMAGGYGRYRTAEWVRQPQPILLSVSSPSGPRNVIPVLEQAQETILSERELRKRKRLTSFSRLAQTDLPITKLKPVTLEGCGRVLLNFSGEEEIQGPDLLKKKGATRRKKKAIESVVKEKKAGVTSGIELLDKPDWPDLEFPWCLRQREWMEELRAEEGRKRQWIERFLESESEGESEPSKSSLKDVEVNERWESVHATMASCLSRKKCKFLSANLADARTALLSKRRVLTLAFLRGRRHQGQHKDGEDILCSCNGIDDGRELVQCNGCEMWYHLDCIGITDAAELGDEEDPWYCHDCEVCVNLPISPSQRTPEPTFAPSDDAPRRKQSFDNFYEAPTNQNSPVPWILAGGLQTATPGSRGDLYPRFFSDSWKDFLKRHPFTPQLHSQLDTSSTAPIARDISGYSHTLSRKLDPSSTPSRGFDVGPSFNTPKENSWSTRRNGHFQTPRASNHRNSVGKTPVKPGERAHRRRVSRSPLTSRMLGSVPCSLFDESPVVRLKKNRPSTRLSIAATETKAKCDLP